MGTAPVGSVPVRMAPFLPLLLPFLLCASSSYAAPAKGLSDEDMNKIADMVSKAIKQELESVLSQNKMLKELLKEKSEEKGQDYSDDGEEEAADADKKAEESENDKDVAVIDGTETEGTVMERFSKYQPTPTDDGLILKIPVDRSKKETVFKFKVKDLKELAKALKTKEAGKDYNDYSENEREDGGSEQWYVRENGGPPRPLNRVNRMSRDYSQDYNREQGTDYSEDYNQPGPARRGGRDYIVSGLGGNRRQMANRRMIRRSADYYGRRF